MSHQSDVWLYVLEGEMYARVGEEVVKGTTGCWVRISVVPSLRLSPSHT